LPINDGSDYLAWQSTGCFKRRLVADYRFTGGSAAAAGTLVRKLGGQLVGYLFLMELDFLKGRDKLDAAVQTLLSGQEEALSKK
jgi:adenine phosphoribosyltransferase